MEKKICMNLYLYVPAYFLLVVIKPLPAYGRGDFHLLHSQEEHRLGRGQFLVLP